MKSLQKSALNLIMITFSMEQSSQRIMGDFQTALMMALLKQHDNKRLFDTLIILADAKTKNARGESSLGELQGEKEEYKKGLPKISSPFCL